MTESKAVQPESQPGNESGLPAPLLVAALIASIVGLAGCGPSIYQKATASYAETVSTASESLRQQTDAGVSLCELRRQLNWLTAQIDSTWTRGREFDKAKLSPPTVPSDPPAALGGTPEQRIAAMAATLIQEGVDSGECTVAEKDRDAFEKAVTVLGRYADGLKAVAAGAKYDGTSLKDATSSVTAIKPLGLSSDAQTAINGIGGLLDGLVQAILNAYAERKIREALHTSEPAVDRIVALMQAKVVYDLQSLRFLDTDANTFLARALDGLKLRSDGTTPAVDALAFYEFARKLRHDTAAMYRRQVALNGVLESLRSAHHELRKAGEAKSDPELADLQGYVKQFGTLVDQVHALIALDAKGGQ